MPKKSGRKRPSAGPRKKMDPERREKFLTIWRHSEMIADTADKMWRAGQKVSITNIYHTIKDELGLPGHYDFDYGDAIREVLHDAGWGHQEAGRGVMDWSPE